MRFTDEDLANNNGQYVYGRIVEYSQKKGYGHIYAENRKDVFLSSYALNKLEKKIAIGTTVKFIPQKIENKVCATEIEIVDLYPSGRIFPLPGGQNVFIKKIQKFGIVSGERAVKDLEISEEALKKAELNVDDVQYVYVIVGQNEHRYVDKKVPVENYRKVDAEKYFRKLCNMYFYL